MPKAPIEPKKERNRDAPVKYGQADPIGDRFGDKDKAKKNGQRVTFSGAVRVDN